MCTCIHTVTVCKSLQEAGRLKSGLNRNNLSRSKQLISLQMHRTAKKRSNSEITHSHGNRSWNFSEFPMGLVFYIILYTYSSLVTWLTDLIVLEVHHARKLPPWRYLPLTEYPCLHEWIDVNPGPQTCVIIHSLCLLVIITRPCMVLW